MSDSDKPTLTLVGTTKAEVEALGSGGDTNETNSSNLSGGVDLSVMTPEKVKALEEERLFRNESEIDAANRLFREHLVPVAAALVNTAIFSPNHRVKLEAQKIILDRTMGRVQDVTVEQQKDPFKELL